MGCSLCEALFHYITAAAVIGAFVTLRRQLNKKKKEKEIREKRLEQAQRNGYILSQAMDASVALNLQFAIETFKKLTDVEKIGGASNKDVKVLIERVEELHLFYTTSLKDKVWHKKFESIVKDLDDTLNDALKRYVRDGDPNDVLSDLNQVEYTLRRLYLEGLIID